MNYKTIGLGIASLSILAISCSSGFKRPESIEDKMARFKAKNLSQNTTPGYKVATVEYKRGGRGPASATEMTKTGSSNISNKRLYFLSLNSQYQQLKQFVDHDSAPEINICPKFHTSLVKYKETYGENPYKGKVYTPKFAVSSITDDTYASKFPELFLPVTKDSVTPTVRDMISKTKNIDTVATVKKAMQIHLSKTYSELKELCDYGSSDNYYVFENLLTHIQRKDGLKKNNENMGVLIKTTLIGNMALISSMKEQSKVKASRGIASTPTAKVHYEDEVLVRMNADWSKEYFYGITQDR